MADAQDARRRRTAKPPPLRIAIIGAGGLGFTRTLARDILCVPHLQHAEFALTDIDAHNLARIEKIVATTIRASRLPARILATTDRREALSGARYVINAARVGGLEAFAHDIRIPLKYGVDQCVGDTICAGGIMYGQRAIPATLEFCRDCREVAAPGAIFFNYANPMAMNTWAALEQGGVETIGLCHGVQHGAAQLAEVLGADASSGLDYLCSGINHQTWFIDLRIGGRKIGKEELLAAFERHPRFSREEKVRIDVLKRFGCYSTESNGHLSEYLPWYRKRADEIAQWVDFSSWINGETGGYLRVCEAERENFEKDYARRLKEAKAPVDPAERSQEHLSHIIEALETGKVYRGHFNVRNNGIVANLPADAVVESTGYVDRFGLNMRSGIVLPDACAATCIASINVQRMAVKAAVTGDVDLLKQAMLLDPLVGAVCSPPEVWRMVDELLVAEAQWLPQYAAAMPAAKQRLAASEVKTREWVGGAVRPKSV